jgi:tetratricopeptide (TPR) repeat protein
VRIAVWRWSASVLCLALLGPVALHAQEDDPLLENRLLRSASTAESSGDLSVAEETLRSLLDQRPTSTGGLFALERVLRTQNRVREVLPFAERYAEIEPNTSSPRLVQLRVLTELEDEDGLRDAAESWMDSGRSSPEPYREVGAVFARVFGSEQALSILQRGRDDLGQPSLFAMEMGDLLKDLGRMDEAVLEWGAVLGDDGSSVSAVMRRVGEIEEDRERLVLPLLEQLRNPPTTAARLRAGARIALEAGAFAEARSLAEAALESLEDRARRGFLTALARQAQEVAATGVALWAYEVLRDGAGEGVEIRALDQRITAMALEIGDTVRALEAQQAIADDLPEGSPDRQQALAEIIRLGIAWGEADMRESLEAFGGEFPDAPQLDELAVTLAVQLDADGDQEGARSLLAGVVGPRSALERGYLHLSAGEVAPGREALQAALPGVSAAAATEVIALLDVLDRLEGEPLAAFIRGAVLAHHGRTDEALSELEAAVDAAPRDERSSLLAMGARIADEGRVPEKAADFRERIIRDHSYSAQVPEATLELARFKAATPAGVAEAIRLLEDLILGQPNSAIVPTARRELQRIQRGPDS